MTDWITSDTHFYHDNIMHYCNRPFTDPCTDCDGVCRNDSSDRKEWDDILCKACRDYGVVPDVNLMNETLIENWNSLIKKGDRVYLLGDFAFTTKDKVTALARKLNGDIHWIYGNHDKEVRGAKGFAFQGDSKEVSYKYEGNKYKIVLSHYPFMTWNRSGAGSLHCHGHCHGNLPDDEKSLRFDVGVDCWDLKPVKLDTIIELAKKRKAHNLKTIGKEIWSADHH
jgi:calcineurin-like phosphoesterase family protein